MGTAGGSGWEDESAPGSARLGRRRAGRRLARTRQDLERLQQLTAALSGAATPDEVIDATLDNALPAVGADAGIAAELAPDGEMLQVVGARGYAADIVEAVRRFPLSADLPLAAAVRDRRLVHYPSRADMLADLPGMLDHVAVEQDVAVAAMPLITNAGVLGAIGVSFSRPATLTEGQRTQLEAVTGQCAQALERAWLYEREAQARASAERASERIEFLARASEVLSSRLDVRHTMRSLARLSVAELADGCLVYLGDVGHPPELVAVAHRQGLAHTSALQEAAEQIPVALDDEAGIGLAMRTRRTQLLTDLAAAVGTEQSDESRPPGPSSEEAPTVAASQAGRVPRGDPLLRVLHGLGAVSAVIAPIGDASGVRGAMVLLAGRGRSLGPEESSLAQELARRASNAATNAMAFEERARIARRLQRSLLPTTLPSIPNVELAARYVVGGEGLEVGGDFYDAFAAPGGTWVLAVGDVRGKGVDAAAVTGTARTALRSAARHDASPRSLLAHLNAMLLQAEGEREQQPLTVPRFCTVAVAVLEPREGGARARISSAGHPLPLLVRPDGEVRAVGIPGMLLGVFEHFESDEQSMDLAEGDALVLLTDGLLERRDGDRFFEDDLEHVLAESAGASAQDIASRLEAEGYAFGGQSPNDDMAVLVARVALPG